jgi:pheophorbide a oxygenase
VHPSFVVDGMLWAWAEGGGADVALRALAAPPSSLPPEMRQEEATEGAHEAGAHEAGAQGAWRANQLGWYVRDLPLPAEMVVENFLDASHVPFSHHGVMGSRDADNALTMRPSGGGNSGGGGAVAAAVAAPPVPSSSSAAFSVRAHPPGRAAYGISFSPPGLVRYDFGGVAMVLNVTPTDPGRCRIFLSVIEPPPKPSAPASSSSSALSRLGRLLLPRSPADLDPRRLARWVAGLKHRWIPLYHATNRNAALDGDALLLYEAQRELQRLSGRRPPLSTSDDGGGGGGAAAAAAADGGSSSTEAAAPAASLSSSSRPGHGVDWRRLYYMPASADLPVAAWRRWLDERGRSLQTLPHNARALGLAPPPAPLSRAEIFDRYEQHTRHCPHCLRALSACNWGLGILAAIAFAALAFAFAGASLLWLSSGGTLPPPLPPSPLQLRAAVIAGAAVAALAAWAASALWNLRMLFIFYDYKHAEH